MGAAGSPTLERMRARPWQSPIVGAVFVVAWVALDWTTLALHRAPGFSPWYPGAGLTVTLLYRFGVRYAPLVVVAEMLRWTLYHDPAYALPTTAIQGVIVGGVYAGGVLLAHRSGLVLPSVRVRDALAFCGLALLLAFVTSALSVALHASAGSLSPSGAMDQFRVFWLGDAVGILAFAPVLDLAISAARGYAPAAYRRVLPAWAELSAVALIAALNVVALGVLRLDPQRAIVFALVLVPVAALAAAGGMRGAIIGIAAVDVALVAIAIVSRVDASQVAGGQLDVILQTILALVLGAMTSTRERLRILGRWLLLHDARTSLPNRAALETWARGPESSAMWVACIDLDAFGLLDIGMTRRDADAVLQAACETIGATVSDAQFFGRFESDAFVVAHAGDREAALAAAERIARAFLTPLRAAGAEFRFTLSIGIAHGVRRDRRALLIEGLAAMAEASEAGGNRAVVFASADDPADRARLASELVRARDDEQFLLHYQPIHELDGERRMVGAEALLRWQHPTRGLLRPAAFLTQLELSGLLADIEPWIVREASATASELRARVPGMRVWINISAGALFDPAFVEALPRIVRRAGAQPSELVIEVTERIVSGDEIGPVLERLHATGVHVAIDDFGTGHSSLGRLRAARVDIIKLDRSLVAAIDSDRRAQSMTSALRELAEGIAVTVVGEGIETEAEAGALQRCGYRFGQGYALSEPMDRAALRAYLARYPNA